MQGEAERALRCLPPSLPNRPHFDADSIDWAIPQALGVSADLVISIPVEFENRNTGWSVSPRTSWDT